MLRGQAMTAKTTKSTTTTMTTTHRHKPVPAPALPTEVLESFWLEEVREGASPRTIAQRERVSLRRVQLGVSRARLRELAKARSAAATAASARRWDYEGTSAEARMVPRLIPLFPIESFTPTSTCGHHRPIRTGSRFCCMVCHTSGMDDHPGLKRDPRTDPAPEPKDDKEQTEAQTRSRGEATSTAETRKERRKRRFVANASAN